MNIGSLAHIIAYDHNTGRTALTTDDACKYGTSDSTVLSEPFILFFAHKISEPPQRIPLINRTVRTKQTQHNTMEPQLLLINLPKRLFPSLERALARSAPLASTTTTTPHSVAAATSKSHSSSSSGAAVQFRNNAATNERPVGSTGMFDSSSSSLLLTKNRGGSHSELPNGTGLIEAWHRRRNPFLCL